MSVLIVGGVLSGIVLGQFFKWFVLFPAFGFATIVALSNPLHVDSSLWGLFLALLALITSLQVGYVAGLVAHDIFATKLRRAATVVSTGAQSHSRQRGARGTIIQHRSDLAAASVIAPSDFAKTERPRREA